MKLDSGLPSSSARSSHRFLVSGEILNPIWVVSFSLDNNLTSFAAYIVSKNSIFANPLDKQCINNYNMNCINNVYHNFVKGE